MTPDEISARLAVLEADVPALKANISAPARSHPARAIERIHAAFPDDRAYREAARLGRRWRRDGSPVAPKGEGELA